MPTQRRLHLGAFMRPVSIHTGAWRYPGAWPEANFSFSRIFVTQVVPELQRRGISRAEYEGTTLREHLGLPRPENRFFPKAARAAE